MAISVGAAVLTLALATVIVVGWPADRFKGEGPTEVGRHRHVVIRALALVGKNLAGGVLVVLGLIMALPGVPGRGCSPCSSASRCSAFRASGGSSGGSSGIPALLGAINRLRTRFARPPLELD